MLEVLYILSSCPHTFAIIEKKIINKNYVY